MRCRTCRSFIMIEIRDDKGRPFCSDEHRTLFLQEQGEFVEARQLELAIRQPMSRRAFVPST